MKKYLPLLFILSNSLFGFAQNPDLDNTFGTNGVTFVDVSPYDDQSECSCLQSDGKIISAGISFNASGYMNMSAFRVNDDGSIDNTFDGDGSFIYSDNYHDAIAACAVQSDGKIILVGTQNISLYVIRLNGDGTYDNTFASAGVYSSLVQLRGGGAGVTLQSDGKILIAGNSLAANGKRQATLIRLNSDGTLDTNFDSDGQLFITAYEYSAFSEVKILSDGRIVTAGRYYTTGSSDDGIIVAMVNSDGSLDSGFDGDGIALLQPSAEDEYLRAMEIQSDDKILLGGSSYNPVSQNYMLLIRLNTDGTLDNSFNQTGIYMANTYSNSSDIYDLKVLSSGRIYAAGEFSNYLNIDGTSKFYGGVLAFTASGTIDNSFGYQGTLLLDLSTNTLDYFYTGIQVKPSGRIVITGYGGSNHNPSVVQLNQDYTFATSIYKKVLNKADIKLYPNPSFRNDAVMMENILNTRVSVKSLMGELMYQNTFSDNEGTIPVQNFSPGTYILEISKGDSFNYMKLVIH